MKNAGKGKGVSLAQMLDQQSLRELAGATAFERGQAYAAAGRVISLTAAGHTASAQVQGARIYEVRLWKKGKKLQYSCTCPYALEGAFCKHCVAACLILSTPSRDDSTGVALTQSR